MAKFKVCIVWQLLILILLLPETVWAETNARVEVGLFSQINVDGWKVKEFDGITNYYLTLVDGKRALAADSNQSASALYKKLTVDLSKTPILNWSWRKKLPINPGNELNKDGDDFVARIYVVKSGGVLWWRTIALNYVWSYQHKKNQSWDNPFVGAKSKMLAQRDATDPSDTWFVERRNVAMDFKKLMGKDIRNIDGVAIMTDSDNSGLSAVALYGDIYFSASEE